MKREIRGKLHVQVVLKIVDRDELGRPKTCTVGYDDTVFHLDGGEEFMTAFVPENVVKKAS